jgi:hypothetical protein
MRGRDLFRGRLLPLTISVLAGGAIGVAIAGLPSTNALSGRGGSPDLTVKPGALIDLVDLTVPALVTIPEPLPPAPESPSQTTTTVPSDGLRERSALLVEVTNANGATGIARTWADRALALGYADPNLSMAPVATDSIIYYADGFEGEAQRLADELGTTSLEIRPIADAPTTSPVFAGELLILIGRNVPELPG